MEQIGNRPVKPYGLTARQRVSENGTNQPIIFGASDEPTYSLQDTNKYAKKKMPMTEYQEKIGIRSQSSLFEMAHDKPYIEIADEGLKGDIHGQSPSIDLLTPNEIYKLTTVSKPSMIKPQSKLAMQKQKMAKLDEPYKIEELSRDNTDPKAYIEKNLGEKQLYPSQEPSHGDGMGSNIKFDYKKEAHMGTQPKSARELYNQVYMNRKAISGINFAQRDAVKANELLNMYSRQSPNRPVEQQTNPMEVEEQKQEAKDEQKVEQIQQGKQSGAGSIVQQGKQSLASGSSPSGLVQQGIEAVGSVIMNPLIKAGMRELELQ
jgi:hypothetical protein